MNSAQTPTFQKSPGGAMVTLDRHFQTETVTIPILPFFLKKKKNKSKPVDCREQILVKDFCHKSYSFKWPDNVINAKKSRTLNACCSKGLLAALKGDVKDS